ncbi:MAG: RimJ/RimL family protein N-acetyltransferase [Polyangiales bacterium]
MSFRVRALHARDAEALWHLDKALVEDGRGMVLGPSDLPPTPADKETSVHKRLADAFAYTLVALHGESRRLVGYAEWNRLRPLKLRHNVVLAMGVSPEFQGQGVGRLLLRQLVEDARRAEPAITRIELGVVADNTRARALYESVGFHLEGVRRAFVQDERGKRDDCLMSLLL